MSIKYKLLHKNKRKTFLILSGMCFSLLAFGANPSGEIQIVFENRNSADSIMSLYPDMNFERVIPIAHNPEIEARHRESGMDLWYVATASSKAKTRSAGSLEPKDFENMKGVRGVFETQLIEMPESPSISDADFTQQEPRHSPGTRSAASMNDPLYPRQWHYDMINMEKAWELEQGKRNVIVAVMDGWIDHNHPDLAANMWVNEAELNGQPGVDDDGNGYVDDIYGYNTSKDPEYYSPHGTHVAGTVAAVNNNGIGVCSVAGGNGIDTGVKLMSIGIVNEGTQIADWKMARGFVYAADNGAVISQNSWQSGDTKQSPVLNDAINYFMENAGKKTDNPMKGGLVIFAAGNDHSNNPHTPLNGESFNRDRFMAVGAISAEKIRTSFSNYGWWVDVAAPGGEQDGTSIMSTTTNGGYQLMNGTSMACPHVSGVAALIVSKFASADLTPEFVKNRIISTATPMEGYQAGYNHEKETSLGLVNAYAALFDVNKSAPGIPKDFSVKMYDSYGLFSWTIPADSNGNPPSVCRIYGGNEDVPFAIVKTAGAEVGAHFEYLDKSGYLDDHTEYTIEAVDCDGNKSGRSEASGIDDCTHELTIINPYNIEHFVVYKPSAPKFTESLGEVTLKFFVNGPGSKTVEIESPLDFIKCDYFMKDCVVTFDVSDTTSVGTFPFTIKVYKKGEPENAVFLPLTCTIKKPLCYNDGVTCDSEDKILTAVETNQRTGSLSIDLAKYLTHPWGSNFTIIEKSETTMDESLTLGYVLTYGIIDGVLNVEYDFTSAFTFSQATIRVDVVDEYMKSSRFYVDIIFSENFSGVEAVVPDNAQYKSGIYTIYGVKLDCEEKDLPFGIYIINRKKVLIHRQ